MSTDPIAPTLTERQRAALKWLRDHGGEGVFGQRGGVLLATGEGAPFMRVTWSALRRAGLVEWTAGSKRVRVTPAGAAFQVGKTWPREGIETLGGRNV